VIKVCFNCLANCFHNDPGNESLARRLESGVSGLLLTYSIFLKGVIIYILFLFFFDTFKMNTGFFINLSYFFFPGPILVPVFQFCGIGLPFFSFFSKFLFCTCFQLCCFTNLQQTFICDHTVSFSTPRTW
jgi:hypothetical protein